MSIIQKSIYDDTERKMVVKTTYDSSALLEQNKALRNSRTKSEQYKGNLVHVGSLHEGDLIRLKNLGYNLLSSDKDEKKRALLYIQQNEPHLLTVNGKPFSKNRKVWV